MIEQYSTNKLTFTVFVRSFFCGFQWISRDFNGVLSFCLFFLVATSVRFNDSLIWKTLPH